MSVSSFKACKTEQEREREREKEAWSGVLLPLFECPLSVKIKMDQFTSFSKLSISLREKLCLKLKEI
jgi:hypothetical protein